MPNIDTIASNLQSLLGEGANSIATKSGFTKKRSKITGSILVLVLVVGFIKTTNAIESMFSQVRDRTDRVDVFTTEKSCLSLVWATAQGIAFQRIPVGLPQS